MSTTPDKPRRLALIALDLDGGDAEAVEAVVARLAQVFRHRVHGDAGVTAGEAQALLVPDLTVNDFLAMMASLKASDG